jgi:DNA-binding transcriptional LysR family regulator
MNFKQLEAFYWLAKLGSYQKVAKQINLTQPAVSIRVGSLESELGAPLLQRDQPGVVLTERGYTMAEFAEEFMQLNERMQKTLIKRERGAFVVGIIEPILFTWGRSFAHAVKQVYPNAEFRVSTNATLRQLVAEQTVDLVFATATVSNDPVPQSFVMRAPMGWVASTALAIDDTVALNVDDIAALPLVFYPRENSQAAPRIEAVAEVRGLNHTENTAVSLSTASEMVRQGFGVSPLVLAALAQSIERGEVRQLRTSVALPFMEIRCFYMNSSRRKIARDIYRMAGNAAQEWCESHPSYATFLPA